MKHKNLIFSTLLFSIFSHAQNEMSFYNTDIFFSEGVEFTKNSKFDESTIAYNKIHKLDPKYSQAQYEMILSLLYADKKEEALQVCEKNYNDKLHEVFPPLLLVHGIILSDQGKYDEALKIFNEADQYFPNSAGLNYNKAIVYVRKDEKQKAVDLLKTNIKIDPSHSSSLYNLGLLALDDGQLVEGNLLLMTYLLFEPENAKAKQALISLNEDYSKTYTAKPKLKIKEKGDDFSLLEEVLRNKYPYNSKFNLLIEFDDLAPRNMQAITEYFKDHEIKDGYFENQFGQLFKYIAENNLTKEYLYHSLSLFNSAFQKEYKKNEKKINEFYTNHLSNVLWYEMYNKAYLNGNEYKVFVDEKSKSFYQFKDGESDGDYFYTSNLGYLETKGSVKQDLLVGKKTTFFENGNVQLEENFKNGKKDGEAVTYYPNKKLMFKGSYKDDKLNGKYTVYLPTEKISCDGIYLNDEFEGENICYFPDGKKKIIANYKKGKFDGPFKKFNETGEIIEQANYLDGEIEGEYNTYFSKDKLKSVNTVKNKKPISYVSYFSNGNKESEFFYNDGKLKEIKEYNTNGTLSFLKSFNDKEELNNLKYYNKEGKLFYEDIYTGGKAKQSVQYFADGTSQKLKNNGLIKFNDLEGTTISEGNIKNGLLEGEWIYYYPNKVLRSKNNYTNGEENGLRTAYLDNGSLDYIAQVSNGKMNGLYKDYINDKISYTAYYKDDLFHGPLTSYYLNGNIKGETFYVDGLQEGQSNTYAQDGRLTQTTNFINDIITDIIYYYDGKSDKIDYVNQNGIVEVIENKAVKRKVSIKNGNKDGIYEISNSKNEPISKENYVNNKLHGKATEYNALGKIEMENNYHSGVLNGTSKNFDLNGKMNALDNFENGIIVGKSTIYYPNEKEFLVSTYDIGVKTGPETYYNSDGTKVLILNFNNNNIVSYQTLNNENQLGQEIPITSEMTVIKSNFSNGKPALEMSLKNGILNNDLIIYNSKNQKDFQINYKNGKVNGTVTYFLNGKKYKTLDYIDGILDGQIAYYNEQEQILYSTDYKNNEKHGFFKVLENNTLKPIKKYDSDQLAEIL
ncbi:tetratricopeptide repeat protein [Flavobacterium sp. I3-2]|uniref:tetratricopeptide repeat protein n=1 Tax=Flavobacterium sp. I3-2 TaxID=2748319 RepID=UPI0015ABB92C|nr:tetratricopeptide repeat protein [Flavobacterium sp. I3-2]